MENCSMSDNRLTLGSTKSTRISLTGVRTGRYSLNKRRQKLLDRVPASGDYAKVEFGTLELIDLAYLSAKTGDEFAILRSKHEDILFHGTPTRCTFKGELEDGLASHRYMLIGHSHPGEDVPEPSLLDRAFLREIGQQKSEVVSGRTGRIVKYTNGFYDYEEV